MTELSDDLEEIRKRYTYGSVFLTRVPLHDLKYLLSDSERSRSISLHVPMRDTPTLLRTFLKKNDEPPNRIAFVQLDLNTKNAGFKDQNEQDGNIRNIGWTENEFRGVAIFADIFLNRLETFESAVETLNSKKTSIKKAWNVVQEIQKDPFVTAERTATLLPKLKGLIDQKPDELQSLLRTPGYESIAKFSTEYDTYLQKQRTNKAEIAVHKKMKEIRSALEFCGTTYAGLVSDLSKSNNLSSLKANVAAFETVGLLTGIKKQNGENVIKVIQSLSGASGMKQTGRERTKRASKAIAQGQILAADSSFRISRGFRSP